MKDPAPHLSQPVTQTDRARGEEDKTTFRKNPKCVKPLYYKHVEIPGLLTRLS